MAAATLAAAFGPYLIFDVLFQETVTTRYALPLVVPAAWLAAIGLAAVMPRWGAWAVAGLAAVALAVAQPTLIAYASEAAPAFRMLADMRAETGRSEPPVLAVHRRQDFDLRRPLKWMGARRAGVLQQLAAPPRLEWLELVDVLEQRRPRTGVVRHRPGCAATSRSSTTARRARRTGGRSVSASSSAACGRTKWTGTRSIRLPGISARAGR